MESPSKMRRIERPKCEKQKIISEELNCFPKSLRLLQHCRGRWRWIIGIWNLTLWKHDILICFLPIYSTKFFTMVFCYNEFGGTMRKKFTLSEIHFNRRKGTAKFSSIDPKFFLIMTCSLIERAMLVTLPLSFNYFRVPCYRSKMRNSVSKQPH